MRITYFIYFILLLLLLFFFFFFFFFFAVCTDRCVIIACSFDWVGIWSGPCESRNVMTWHCDVSHYDAMSDSMNNRWFFLLGRLLIREVMCYPVLPELTENTGWWENKKCAALGPQRPGIVVKEIQTWELLLHKQARYHVLNHTGWVIFENYFLKKKNVMCIFIIDTGS